MPFTSTRVFHPRWAQHLASVADDTHNVTVKITAGSTGGGWSPTSGATQPTVTVLHEGPAIIEYDAQSGAHNTVLADQQVVTRTVTVGLGRTAPVIPQGARVTVTAVDDNTLPALVGRVFVVAAVVAPSHGVEQTLSCVDDQTNQPS